MRLRLQSTSKFIAYEVNTKKHRLIKLFKFSFYILYKNIQKLKSFKCCNFFGYYFQKFVHFERSFSYQAITFSVTVFTLFLQFFSVSFLFGLIERKTHISLAKMNENIFQVIEPIQITFFALNKTIITIKSDKRIKREIPTRC